MLIGPNSRRRSRISYLFARICLVLLVTSAHVRAESPPVDAESVTGPRIPEESITRLQQKLAAVEDMESATEKRRACKNIVRRAETLLEEYPASPDRFRVLGVIFESRKALFTRSSSEEYREALLIWQRWICSSRRARLVDGTCNVDSESALS